MTKAVTKDNARHNFLEEFIGRTYNRGAMVPVNDGEAETLFKRHGISGFIIVPASASGSAVSNSAAGRGAGGGKAGAGNVAGGSNVAVGGGNGAAGNGSGCSMGAAGGGNSAAGNVAGGGNGAGGRGSADGNCAAGSGASGNGATGNAPEGNAVKAGEFASMIKDEGFAYTPVFGEICRTDKSGHTETAYERALVVFPKSQRGYPCGIDNLIGHGMKWAAIHEQDGFLVKRPGEAPLYMKADGGVSACRPEGLGFADLTREYFNQLHGHDAAFDYLGAYIHPRPQCLNEAHTRWLRGEIALTYS